MGVIIPEGFGQASLLFGLAGKPDEMVVTFGYIAGGIAPSATPGEILTSWTGSGKPFFGAAMMTGWTVKGVRTTEMTSTGPLVYQHMAAVVGTASGATAPPNCAVLVRKLTARGGRKGRGRMFLPPCVRTETDIDALGNFDAAWASAFDAKLALSLADMVTTGNNMYLLHEDGTAPNEVTALSTQLLLGTQRRRMR